MVYFLVMSSLPLLKRVPCCYILAFLSVTVARPLNLQAEVPLSSCPMALSPEFVSPSFPSITFVDCVIDRVIAIKANHRLFGQKKAVQKEQRRP